MRVLTAGEDSQKAVAGLPESIIRDAAIKVESIIIMNVIAKDLI